ncbi:hypothetical protein [Clostridium sp. L74]|uniref:hypothetical protein n=1 Tax=Clostridium sp. L74 TaxID=1560217 RepID=UPI0006ABB983|nr:hypothetical protein [Clostridium sp. L74]KOR25308.1 hypothetical protein ND00_18190 [Clostridium sp. L74]
MKCNKSYIFKNIYGNMYEFYINKNNDLMCNKFSEEIKILENVSQFNINITYLGIVEIVCITFDGFIKYCKFNKKWSIQTLYKLKSHNNNIDEVNLFSKGNKLHIFFMFYENRYDSMANILHYVWDGNKFETNIIGPINTIKGIEKHYYLEILNNSINMFYITKEKNSNVINLCKYLDNNLWSNPKKLYRLNGNDINFSTLNKNKEFNILNISEENGICTLEHVIIDSKDNINSFSIHKTNTPIYKSTFIIFNNILYCMWSEDGTLMYSSFNDTKWSNSAKIETNSFDNIDMYRYIYEKSPLDKSIDSKNIFASISDNINIFLPKITKTYNNTNNDKYDAESTIRKLLQEISKKNAENYDLHNKTILLTQKLKEKNIYVNNLSENLNKISIQKSNIENKYKSILEINNNLKIETEKIKKNINKKYEESSSLKVELKSKIEENSSLNEHLNNTIEKFKNENLIAIKNLENKYLMETKDIKNQLKDKQNKFKILLDKNKILEESIKELKLENNNVKEKLETSKNNILSNLKSKYDTEVSTIKEQLKEKEKSFEYITDYSQKLETTLDELKSENSLIKQELENSRSKSFIERLLGKPYK